jgi:hypothetical protein
MGGQPLTNEVGAKALRKLEAVNVTPKGAPHPKFDILFRGEIIASTGLRHSSKKDIGVPHLKNDLRVPVPFVLDLARCPKDREDWLRRLGYLAEGESEKGDTEPENAEPSQGS